MPQDIVSQFDRKYALPIETYRQVQTVALRNAIPNAIRWEGMIVYVIDESKSYELKGGTNDTFWIDLGSLVNVNVVDNLLSTSTTDALSANQGRLLKALIDAGGGGGGSATWGAIVGTLSDQTDLQDALNTKLGVLDTAGNSALLGGFASTYFYPASNPNGYTDDQTPLELLNAIKTVDGPGSGLDADLLDGFNSDYFYPASNPNGYTNDQTPAELLLAIKTVDGPGSGLDADLLDGFQGSQYLRSDISGTLTGTLTATGNVIANAFVTTSGIDGSINFNKSDGAQIGIQFEDNYYRWRIGGSGSIAGWRWDNFDTTAMTLTSSGNLTTTGQSTASSFKTGNWTIETSGTSLVFKLSGVTMITIGNSGNIQAAKFFEI